MSEVEEVTNTQHVAAMVSGHATGSSIALVKTISYRLPISLLGPVDAMANKAKKSRNAMLNLLLQVGIDEVRRQLDPDAAESLMYSESAALAVLLGDEMTTETIEE